MSKQTVPITGVMLRGDGKDIVVEVEIGNRWIEVIREYAADNTDTIAHIVETRGIQRAWAAVPRSGGRLVGQEGE